MKIPNAEQSKRLLDAITEAANKLDENNLISVKDRMDPEDVIALIERDPNIVAFAVDFVEMAKKLAGRILTEKDSEVEQVTVILVGLCTVIKYMEGVE